MRPLWLIPLIVLVACTQQDPSVTINDKTYFVEIASTENLQRIGLMNRESLEPNHGMLFVFEEEALRGFWMKNTTIPLDIVYIYANYSIESVVAATPCTADPCPVYRSGSGVKYVLEVNQGSGIKEGDGLIFSGVKFTK